MNSNGNSFQNYSSDNPRGNSYRFRGNSKRGRHRGLGDRSGNSRHQNFGGDGNRRPNQQSSNYNRRSSTNVDTFLDLNDTSQFPSIEETSRPAHRSSMSSQTQDRNTEQNRENQTTFNRQGEENELNYGASNRRSYGSGRGSYQSNYNSNHSSNAQGYQGSGRGGYYDRNYQMNRPRQRYYSGQGRGGQNNRRYFRGYGQPIVSSIIPNDGTFYHPGAYMDNQYLVGQVPVQGQYTDPKNVRPSDPVKQVEYYFSEENLVKDNHLRRMMDKEGWVNLEVIARFKRMQSFCLTFDDMVDILLQSDQLEVDREKKQVRTKNDPQKWPIVSDNDSKILPVQDQSSRGVSPIPLVSAEGNDQNVYQSVNQPVSYAYPTAPFFVQQMNNPISGSRYSQAYSFYGGYYPYPYMEMPFDQAVQSYYHPPERFYYENQVAYSGNYQNLEERPSEETQLREDESTQTEIKSETSDTKDLTSKISNLNISGQQMS